jgi:hypothetical protein
MADANRRDSPARLRPVRNPDRGSTIHIKRHRRILGKNVRSDICATAEVPIGAALRSPFLRGKVTGGCVLLLPDFLKYVTKKN